MEIATSGIDTLPVATTEHCRLLPAPEDGTHLSLSQTPLLRRNMALAGSRFYRHPHVHAPVSHPFGLSCRFCGRSFLELEVVALRHQLAVLRRQHTGRLRIGSWDRLLWVWLYRLWPQCLEVMVLVKPATVIQWHRAGFRLYWRWRS